MCLALPGKVIDIQQQSDNNIVGLVDYGDIQKKTNLSFVPEVKLGQYVIIHAGFAISVLDEQEAKNSIAEFLPPQTHE